MVVELPDHYNVLGLSRTATIDDIKRAYRQLALKWHPDKNNGDAAATEKFKELAAAFAVLRDARQRKIYDHMVAEQQGSYDLFRHWATMWATMKPTEPTTQDLKRSKQAEKAAKKIAKKARKHQERQKDQSHQEAEKKGDEQETAFSEFQEAEEMAGNQATAGSKLQEAEKMAEDQVKPTSMDNMVSKVPSEAFLQGAVALKLPAKISIGPGSTKFMNTSPPTRYLSKASKVKETRKKVKGERLHLKKSGNWCEL